MLDVRDLRVDYGIAPALWGVSLAIGAGELVCVVGPNGAGKTTLINAIAGLHPAKSGRITMDGREMTALPPHRFCAAGIAHRARRPPAVRANDGARESRDRQLCPRARARPRSQSLDYVCTLFPAVRDKLDAPAGSLSGGQQQMVAIGRALMAQAAAAAARRAVARVVAARRADDVSRDPRRQRRGNGGAAGRAERRDGARHRAIVRTCSRKAASPREGTPDAVFNTPELRRAYLGGPAR